MAAKCPDKFPEKERVLKSRIGQMPFAAEVALGYSMMARQLRHASRCNCGKGHAREGCATRHPKPSKTTEALARHSEWAREQMNTYRNNRRWSYSGATPKISR